VSSPDRTTKMTRAMREANARNVQKFVWPAPPY